MDESEEKQPTGSTFKSVGKAAGLGWSRERINRMYYGNPPPGSYPTNRSLEHIHDIAFTPEQKGRLYGMGPKEEMVMESVTSDTRKDLIIELMDRGLTRRAAEEVVDDLINAGYLCEEYDPDLKQKVIVRR